MSTHDTTQDTLTDRLVTTATIAIVEMDCNAVDDSPGSWIGSIVKAIQFHIVNELLAQEQAAGRSLSLQQAVSFLLQEVKA